MGMKLLGKVRDSAELTNYGLSKKLRELAIEITTSGIDGYDKENALSMRLDVLCGFFYTSGVSPDQFMNWLIEEFAPQLKRKK